MAGQNTSFAVMNHRAEPLDSAEFFPTPPWATRALCEWLSQYYKLKGLVAADPACGHGDMVKPLREYFGAAWGSDLRDYSRWFPDQKAVEDYLLRAYSDSEAPDFVVTNPPFRIAADFIAEAHQHAKLGCAMLLRTNFLEGVERHQQLFSRVPPTDVLTFAERVIIARGRLRDPAIPYRDANANSGKGALKRPSTATSYSWFIWRFNAPRRKWYRGSWIPKCRARLERPGDYPPLPPEEQIPASRSKVAGVGA